MNVLIFVMTMLMLLSLMTYARLESYRNSQSFQILFKHYMQEEERSYINSRAEAIYYSINVKETEENKDKKQSKRSSGNPRIGIALLFDFTRDNKDKEWKQTRILLKNLMKTLYNTQPFYKKIENQRPAFLDELINAMIQEIDSLPKEKKPTTAADLANLKLPDRQLDRLLYKMLKGAIYMDPLDTKNGNGSKKNRRVETVDPESISDDDIAKEADEFKSPEGYYSILDFITEKSKPNVRIYLAPREVLQSIFHETNVVNSIIKERERLYQEALADSPVDQLSENFKNQFIKLKDQTIDDESLNFDVSKTNPKYYK